MKNFYVIEGEHTNPNEIKTLLKNTEKKHGLFINVSLIAALKDFSL